VYSGNSFNLDSWDLEVSDTLALLEQFSKESPVAVLEELEAEFAMVLYDQDQQCLWFGRDCLGRRSLLVAPTLHQVILASVSSGPGWTEVPTGGLFRIDLRTNLCELVPWRREQLRVPSLLRFTPTHTSDFRELLQQSVSLRTFKQHHLGILFSGGLDSAVLAVLAHRALPPSSEIWLINVSFREDAPDRKAAVSALSEIEGLCEGRVLHLLLKDVSTLEVELHEQTIVDLISPASTLMDLSIATALFFAASTEFPGRVLLSGLGADEIFGGYSRYVTAFVNKGEAGVQEQMSLDLDRLWLRNLGRDDRVVSHHAKELRLPYLDSRLWASLSCKSISEVSVFRGRDKSGLKHALREFARELGLRAPAEAEKRALQFGTRIAQVNNLRKYGSHRAASGTDLL
jgi:asparagine synthetase B (glutamine-hydrolysing)